MSATVYHTFTGCVKGLSSFHINPADVRKIIDITYRKRLFCIFNKEYKFSLDIKYFDPKNETTVSPAVVFAGQYGIGGVFHSTYVETSIMTLRYKTKKEVINVIDEIKMKQSLISKFDNEQNKKLQEFIDTQINKV